MMYKILHIPTAKYVKYSSYSNHEDMFDTWDDASNYLNSHCHFSISDTGVVLYYNIRSEAHLPKIRIEQFEIVTDED